MACSGVTKWECFPANSSPVLGTHREIPMQRSGLLILVEFLRCARRTWDGAGKKTRPVSALWGFTWKKNGTRGGRREMGCKWVNMHNKMSAVSAQRKIRQVQRLESDGVEKEVLM